MSRFVLRRGVPSRSGAARIAAAWLLTGILACSGGRESRLQEVLRRSRTAPEAISGLEKPFLEDPDPDVRALAVWAIGDARAPDAIEVLTPLAKDKDATVRMAVVRALCPASTRTATDAVVALAKDPDTETRRASVRCIAAKSEPAPGVLAVALADNDKEIREAALEGLTRHPEPGAMGALLAVVTMRGAEEQLAAVTALRALRNPEAVPALEKAAAERLSPAVRDAVEAAIIDLRHAAAEPTGDATADTTRDATADAPAIEAPATPNEPEKVP